MLHRLFGKLIPVPDEAVRPLLYRKLSGCGCHFRRNGQGVVASAEWRIGQGLLDYLDASGIRTYVIPQGTIGKLRPSMPYLYSAGELECFFQGADTLPASKLRELIAPVIFRMHF